MQNQAKQSQKESQGTNDKATAQMGKNLQRILDITKPNEQKEDAKTHKESPVKAKDFRMSKNSESHKL